MKNIFLNYVVSLLDAVYKEIKYQQERSLGLFNIGHTVPGFVSFVQFYQIALSLKALVPLKPNLRQLVSSKLKRPIFDSYYFSLRSIVNFGRTFGLAHCKIYVSTTFHTILVHL